MERFFHLRDWWGNGLALWVVALLLLLLPVFGVIVKDVNLENDVTTWLPSDDPDATALAWFKDQFQGEDRIIVSWDSSTLDDPRLEEFASALTRQGDQKVHGVQSVSTPGSVIQKMVDNEIDQEQAIDRLTGILIGKGFLKVQLTEFGREQRGNAENLILEEVNRLTADTAELLPKVSARANAAESASEAPAREGSPTDFTLNMPAHDFQIRWNEMSGDAQVSESIVQLLPGLKINEQPIVESAFFAPGAPVAVAIALGVIDDHALTSTLNDIEATAVASGVPADEIRMAGSPISRARLNQEAARAVWNRDYPAWNLFKRTPVLLSALVGVVVSFVLLKSIRLSLLVMLASVYTCLVVVALIPLTGKSLNMVLIVLPDLLLVLTTSGAIHLANYWKHAISHNDEHPIASAVKMAWQPCLLASLTTAIGMASLLSAVLEPVREFGTYSAIGCIVSLFMILIGFPSLMSIWPGHPGKYIEHADRESTWWGHLARRLVKFRHLVCAGCLVLFGFAVYGLRWFETETKVIRYFPPHTRIARDYHYLEDGLAGIVSLDAVVYFPVEEIKKRNIDERIELIRRVEEELAEHRWISGTLSLADFRDPFPVPGPNATGRQNLSYNVRLKRKEKAIFEEPDQSIREFASEATSPLSVTPHGNRHIVIKTGDELWRIRAQSVVTGDVDYATLTNELDAIVRETLSNEEGVSYLITGMVPLFLRTQEAVLESLIKSFGLAFVVIAFVMMFLLRSFTSGLLAMIPNLFPVGVVFGIVSWLRVPVDIGTMITASVALGIAIDGTLHLLTWFQDGIRKGMSQHDAVVLALQHCGPAMWQTSASIAFGIVMVAGADLLLISRFGLLMSGLVIAALVGDVILLPALLGGWLGRIIQRNTKLSEPVLDYDVETIAFPAGETAGHQPLHS